MQKGLEHEGFLFSVVNQTPILSSSQLDDLRRTHDFAALPDMVFSNRVSIVHRASGVELVFDSVDALKGMWSPLKEERCSESFGVGTGAPAVPKVKAAAVWTAAARDHADAEALIRIQHDYDWTYHSRYRGTVFPDAAIRTFEASDAINWNLLTDAREKILLFSEVVLYEDELADNGVTRCSVKIRVMPKCFLVLLRMHTRVDHVLLKQHDTRVFHEFGTDSLLRVSTVREAKWDEVPHDPLESALARTQNLLDEDWIARILLRLGSGRSDGFPTDSDVVARDRIFLGRG
ncbi:TIP41-like family-domain-containing protein [Hyaloraphidium curvatum]|nr:TIP41-like family-domain-containing protein [Hyaloraphidium curvatum]